MENVWDGPADRLDEIVTNPSALARWAKTPEATTMVVGFEAEMLIRGLVWPDDTTTAEDYDADRDMPSSYDGAFDEIESWFEDGNSFNEQSGLRRAMRMMDRDYREYAERKWDEDDHEDRIRELIGDELGVRYDDPLIDEVIEGRTSAYRRAVGEAKEEWMDEGDVWGDFLNVYGYTTMKDFAEANNLDWPYTTAPDSSVTPEDLEASFVEHTGYDCTVSDSYHGQRSKTAFVMEPDSSLTGEDDLGGLELISPPMPLPSAMSAIEKVFSWMRKVKARTTMRPPTGFHIGVSMPGRGLEKLDKLKLILMMGDEHVLKQFGRERLSRYAASSLKHIRDNLSQPGFDIEAELARFRTFLDIQAAKDISAMITGGMRRENTVSVRPSAGYVEFRSPGGDYLKQQGEIEMAVLRFARALAIASDPMAERKEYAKKLYQLLTSAVEGRDDAIEAFAAYSSGLMSKDDLQRAIRTYRDRKSGTSADGGRTWNVFDTRSGKTVGTIFSAENQLMDRLRGFADRNGFQASQLDVVQPGSRESRMTTYRVSQNYGGNERFDIDAKSPAEALKYAKARWGDASRPDGDFTVTQR